jgi:hypothetical protein
MLDRDLSELGDGGLPLAAYGCTRRAGGRESEREGRGAQEQAGTTGTATYGNMFASEAKYEYVCNLLYIDAKTPNTNVNTGARMTRDSDQLPDRRRDSDSETGRQAGRQGREKTIHGHPRGWVGACARTMHCRLQLCTVEIFNQSRNSFGRESVTHTVTSPVTCSHSRSR